MDSDKRKILCTIGFSRKSMRRFVELLQGAGVQRVLDVRLNNTSQLAGFAKRDDLEFLLSLVGIKYCHLPELAPTEDILKKFKRKELPWPDYENEFRRLLRDRGAQKFWGTVIEPREINCLLCSEDKPDLCHRRLVAEYFAALDEMVDIKHLF